MANYNRSLNISIRYIVCLFNWCMTDDLTNVYKSMGCQNTKSFLLNACLLSSMCSNICRSCIGFEVNYLETNKNIRKGKFIPNHFFSFISFFFFSFFYQLALFCLVCYATFHKWVRSTWDIEGSIVHWVESFSIFYHKLVRPRLKHKVQK